MQLNPTYGLRADETPCNMYTLILPLSADGRDARLVGQRRQREVAAGQGRSRRGRKGRLCRGNVRCHCQSGG